MGSMAVLKQLGMGALVGLPAGIGVQYARQRLTTSPVLDLPEEYVEMPLVSGIDRPSMRVDRKTIAPARVAGTTSEGEFSDNIRQKMDSLKKALTTKSEKAAAAPVAGLMNPSLSHILGGAVGAGAGFSVARPVLEGMRARTLQGALSDRKHQLAELLLAEQRATREKRAGASVFTRPARDVVRGIHTQFTTLDEPRQLLYGGIGSAALLFSALEAYRRSSASDPDRAQRRAMKDALRERLMDVEGTGGRARIQLAPTKTGLEPLRPGASALVDPSRGRDALASL